MSVESEQREQAHAAPDPEQVYSAHLVFFAANFILKRTV